jgi:hypothetical protein
MNELPDNLKDFLTYYLYLRDKAYLPCTKQEASEAGQSRSTHGSNNHRHYSLVRNHEAWCMFRNIERRLNFLRDDMRYYFNPDLHDIARMGIEVERLKRVADLQGEESA